MLPLIFSMTWPPFCSMMMAYSYNLVDSMFVSWAGKDELAAVSLAFPINTFMVSCAIGFGVGINVLVSRHLGEQNQAAANEAKYVDIFTVDSSGAALDPAKAISSVIKIEDIDIATSETGAIGVIRSNVNSGLRSSSDMVLSEECDWGVAPSNLIASWSQESGSVESELILEGGDV